MRNTFFLLLFLINGVCFSQNPDPFWDGIRTKLVQPDTLSTFDRDALTPKLGTILYHKDTGISQWEQWDGSDWVEFGAGAEYTFSDTAEIDLTLTGDDVTADIVAGSIDETKLDASVNASLDLADSANQVPRDSLIVQDPNSFGTLYTYWIGTEAQMDALILIDPNYFDNVLWFCTDCTEVVEVDWGNINGDIDNQADLIARLDLKLNASSYTAADVLSKLLTVDGSGSGLDADLLRGVHWGNVNTPIISSATIRGLSNSGVIGTASGTSNVAYFSFYESNNSTRQGYVGFASSGNSDLVIRNDISVKNLSLEDTGELTYNGAGEFGGTVSGSDPVNNDDFVTKGYLEGSGSFTATLTDEGGGATYSIGSNSGNYYTVGRFVFFQISLQSISTTGTPTGDLQLSGLPFDSITGFGANVYRFTGSSVDFYSITGSYSSSGSGGTQRMEFIIQTSSDGNFSTVLTDCTMTSGSIFVSGVFVKTL